MAGSVNIIEVQIVSLPNRVPIGIMWPHKGSRRVFLLSINEIPIDSSPSIGAVMERRKDTTQSATQMLQVFRGI